MPYIKNEERAAINAALSDRADPQYWTPGQVAYAVYVIMKRYVDTGPSFFAMATVVGAVMLTVARFVLKVVMPYEDQKERDNGGIE